MKRPIPLCVRVFRFVLPCLIAVAAGCSQGLLPTGPGSPAGADQTATSGVAIQSAAGINVPAGSGIAISRMPLTKPAGSQKPVVVEQRIGPRGGLIAAWARDRKTQVWFRVPRGALEKKTTIRMEVIGGGPSVLVKFGPSGLTFLKPCTLSIVLDREDVDPEELGGYLIEKNGKATEVPYSVVVRGRWVIVEISIQHFSIYSPGDGDCGNYNNNDLIDPPP